MRIYTCTFQSFSQHPHICIFQNLIHLFKIYICILHMSLLENTGVYLEVQPYVWVYTAEEALFVIKNRYINDLSISPHSTKIGACDGTFCSIYSWEIKRGFFLGGHHWGCHCFIFGGSKGFIGGAIFSLFGGSTARLGEPRFSVFGGATFRLGVPLSFWLGVPLFDWGFHWGFHFFSWGVRKKKNEIVLLVFKLTLLLLEVLFQQWYSFYEDW